MKKIAKKSILQKTIISILSVILVINFIFPTAVQADFGGVLYTPIQSLLIGLGDCVMWVLNCTVGYSGPAVLYLSEEMTIGDIVLEISTVTNPILSVYRNTDRICEYLGYKGLPGETLPARIEIPVFAISPEKIFANDVPLLDINILNPREDSAAYALQNMISTWYKAFRNLAIVGLLSVLVYVAIRIIISSTASDKAKYKQMLMDWLVALCLIFFIHYIMSFAITMVDSLNTSLKKESAYISLMPVDDLYDKYNGGESYSILEDMKDREGNLATDYMGYVRYLAQTTENGVQDLTEKLGYTIIYITLVIYTVMFTFIYIKRLIYIIFLTIISPLVALTYPLDKISDGKAQAFSTWFKEYTYNLLIQPVHLLLYYLLVGSAIELATKYLIYPLVVLGFLLQAEKILRKFFGFEKGGTGQSFMNGALGGALVMKGIGMLKGSGRSSAKGGNGKTSAKEDTKIRMNARKGDYNRQEENTFMSDTLNNKNAEGKNTSSSRNDENIDDKIMQKYQAEGYGQNANGEYYNPYTDEYDPAYNPINDKNYSDLFNNENEEESQIKMASTDEPTTDELSMYEPLTDEPLMDELPIGEPQIDKPNFLSGAKSLAGRYLMDPDKNKEAAKSLLRNVGKVAGAATLGTVGVAAGLVSDDYSNVAKFGLGAGAVGANVGGNIAEGAFDLPSNAYRKVKEMQDEYRKGAYSKEGYQKIKNAEADNAFLKDKRAIEQYKEAFKGKGKVNGKEYYKYAMEQAVKYRKHGVTDNDTIIKAMKATSKYASADIADDRRIISAKLARGVEKHKDVEDIKNRLKEQHINQDQINDQAEMIRQIKDIF